MGIRSRPRAYEVVVFSGGPDGKESTCSAGDPGLIPGLGRSPGEGNGNPLLTGESPCTEEPRGLQSMEVAKSDATKHSTAHSACFEVIPHCSFDLHFSNNS